MANLKLNYSTVAVLINEEEKLSTFIVSTYCPPDPDRNVEAVEELKNILISVNECYYHPQIIVFSDFNRDLREHNTVKTLNLKDELVKTHQL